MWMIAVVFVLTVCGVCAGPIPVHHDTQDREPCSSPCEERSHTPNVPASHLQINPILTLQSLPTGQTTSDAPLQTATSPENTPLPLPSFSQTTGLGNQLPVAAPMIIAQQQSQQMQGVSILSTLNGITSLPKPDMGFEGQQISDNPYNNDVKMGILPNLIDNDTSTTSTSTEHAIPLLSLRVDQPEHTQNTISMANNLQTSIQSPIPQPVYFPIVFQTYATRPIKFPQTSPSSIPAPILLPTHRPIIHSTTSTIVPLPAGSNPAIPLPTGLNSTTPKPNTEDTTNNKVSIRVPCRGYCQVSVGEACITDYSCSQRHSGIRY